MINLSDSMELTETVILTRLLVSMLLGAAIGLEREYFRHPAGLRTFALVCMGSALAMILSIYLCQTNGNLLNGDPGRIAAQVVTGIGFIGAGLIMKHEDGVSGLTTAACIFMSCIIGLAVGAGLIMVSCIVTVVVLVLLISAQLIRKYQK